MKYFSKATLTEVRKCAAKLPTISDPIAELGGAELRQLRDEIYRAARRLTANLSSLNDAEINEREAAHDEVIQVLDTIDDEVSRRRAAGADEPLREQSGRRPVPEDVEAPCSLDPGSSYAFRSGWQDREGNEVRTYAPGEKLAERRVSGPALGSMLRALITGPRNEAERRALGEGTDSAGGYTVPFPLASEFIDRLRARSVVMRAGAITVPMTSETLDIARLETDPSVAWRDENAVIEEGDPTFGRVRLTARSLAGILKLSRELVEDSVNVSAMLETAFTNAMALELDRACLFGSGTAPEPRGIANFVGIGSVSMGTNGLALSDFDKILDAIYEMAVDNAADPTAMILHPRSAVALAKLKDLQDNPLMVPEMVRKIPALVTTSVPIDQTQGSASNASSIILGDFTKCIVGMRSEIRIEVVRDLYAANHQYALVAHMRADCQLAHVESFSKLIGIIP